MALLQASGVGLSFGSKKVLDKATLAVNRGDKFALTGINGAGKSTFLKIIAGLMELEEGAIHRERHCIIRYLPQSMDLRSDKSVLELADEAFDELHSMQEQAEAIVVKLSKMEEGSSDLEPLLEEYDYLQHQLQNNNYNERQVKLYAVLQGIGFSKEDIHKPCNSFSGGWRMRIALAQILLSPSNVLLLDEPTNYLDRETRHWLSKWINDYPGAIIIVSHDKSFLDRSISGVAELYLGTVKVYKGNFTKYQEIRSQEMTQLIKQYEEQQREIERIELFIRRFRSKATKAAQVQSRIKMLEKMEEIRIPEGLKSIHFQFPPASRSARTVVQLNNLHKSYGENHIFTALDMEVERGEKIALIGPNGAGKSTLLRILAKKDIHYKGTFTYGSSVDMAYFSQEAAEELDGSETIESFIERSAPSELQHELRNLLGAFLFRGEDIYKLIKVLSGGERSRLALLSLLLRPSNLLILDEPTNHLDMTSKDILLQALKEFEGSVIFVSHDDYFIEALATRIIEIEEENGRRKVSNYLGDYQYYLWKKEQEEQSEQAPSQKKGPKKDSSKIGPQKGPVKAASLKDSGDDSGSSRDNRTNKVQHQELKEKRNRKNKLQREEETLLKGIEETEEKIRQIQSAMGLEENYTQAEVIKEMQNTLSNLEKDLEKLHISWEKTSESLEELSDL